MKKKTLIQFFSALMVIGLLVACTQAPSGGGSTSESSSSSVTSSATSSVASVQPMEFVNVNPNAFYLAKGTDQGGSGTTTNIADKECIMINAISVADGSHYAVEVQCFSLYWR